MAAIYHLPSDHPSALGPPQGPEEISRLMPRMLLDIQNRGQLSAGMTTYNPHRQQLIDTYRELGTVNQAFRLNHRGKAESLMREFAGRAAIGHVRYATCGAEDCSYAQPFERHHLQKHKWFSFAFNGQLANYQELRQELLADSDNYLARDTDTEIIMHAIGRELSGNERPPLFEIMRNISRKFDGAYCLVLLNALGDMLVARDPLGLRPLCYAIEGPLFAAASESVALLNLGFAAENIKSLLPGQQPEDVTLEAALKVLSLPRSLGMDPETDEEITYRIVGSHEADVAGGKLSVTAPLGRALIGKTLGGQVEVTTPGGAKYYEIIKVAYK